MATYSQILLTTGWAPGGTLYYKALDAANTARVARTNTGVTDLGGGDYNVTATLDTDWGPLTIVWDAGGTDTASEVIDNEGISGDILTQQDITDFLGDTSLAILSQQDPDALTVSTANVQRAIDKAEAIIKAKLGNGFAIPLTISGTAIISAQSSIAYPILVVVACQLASYWLNKWRAVQALDAQGRMSQAQIAAIAAAWEEDAMNTLNMILRWSQGYSDGLATDLDLLTTSVRSQEAGGIAAVQVVGPRRECTYNRWLGWQP